MDGVAKGSGLIDVFVLVIIRDVVIAPSHGSREGIPPRSNLLLDAD